MRTLALSTKMEYLVHMSQKSEPKELSEEEKKMAYIEAINKASLEYGYRVIPMLVQTDSFSYKLDIDVVKVNG